MVVKAPEPSYGMFIGSILMFGSVYLFYFAYGLIVSLWNVDNLPVNDLSSQQYAVISNTAASLNITALVPIVIIAAIILAVLLFTFSWRSVEASM